MEGKSYSTSNSNFENISSPIAESTYRNKSNQFLWGSGIQKYAMGKSEVYKPRVINFSTKNSSIQKKFDTRTYTDIQSKGLSSRIVKYYNDSMTLNKSLSASNLYNKPGQFPIVNLNKNQIQYKANRNRPISIVRIAPPDKAVFQANTRSSILRSSSVVPSVNVVKRNSELSCENKPIIHPIGNDLMPTRSVLDALKEISRKRINNDDLDGNDIAKKYCKGNNETSQVVWEMSSSPLLSTAIPNSFGMKRQMSPNSKLNCIKQSHKRKMYSRSNDVFSSLSSSIHITPNHKLADIRNDKTSPSENRNISFSEGISNALNKREISEKFISPKEKKFNNESNINQQTLQQFKSSIGNQIKKTSSNKHSIREPQKLKVTLFNKNYNDEKFKQKIEIGKFLRKHDSYSNEVKFVKPRNDIFAKDFVMTKPVIKKIKQSRLALMLNGIRGESDDDDNDEVDKEETDNRDKLSNKNEKPIIKEISTSNLKESSIESTVVKSTAVENTSASMSFATITTVSTSTISSSAISENSKIVLNKNCPNVTGSDDNVDLSPKLEARISPTFTSVTSAASFAKPVSSLIPNRDASHSEKVFSHTITQNTENEKLSTPILANNTSIRNSNDSKSYDVISKSNLENGFSAQPILANITSIRNSNDINTFEVISKSNLENDFSSQQSQQDQSIKFNAQPTNITTSSVPLFNNTFLGNNKKQTLSLNSSTTVTKSIFDVTNTPTSVASKFQFNSIALPMNQNLEKQIPETSHNTKATMPKAFDDIRKPFGNAMTTLTTNVLQNKTVLNNFTFGNDKNQSTINIPKESTVTPFDFKLRSLCTTGEPSLNKTTASTSSITTVAGVSLPPGSLTETSAELKSSIPGQNANKFQNSLKTFNFNALNQQSKSVSTSTTISTPVFSFGNQLTDKSNSFALDSITTNNNTNTTASIFSSTNGTRENSFGNIANNSNSRGGFSFGNTENKGSNLSQYSGISTQTQSSKPSSNSFSFSAALKDKKEVNSTEQASLFLKPQINNNQIPMSSFNSIKPFSFNDGSNKSNDNTQQAQNVSTSISSTVPTSSSLFPSIGSQLTKTPYTGFAFGTNSNLKQGENSPNTLFSFGSVNNSSTEKPKESQNLFSSGSSLNVFGLPSISNQSTGFSFCGQTVTNNENSSLGSGGRKIIKASRRISKSNLGNNM